MPPVVADAVKTKVERVAAGSTGKKVVLAHPKLLALVSSTCVG